MSFGLFNPPPKKKKKIGGRTNFFCWRWKKIKVVQNYLKWQENWSKMILWLFSPHSKKIGGRTNFFCQTWNKSKLFKIAWNGEKIGQKLFRTFQPPPHTKKNKICSKLPEMARKLVENDFLDFSLPSTATKNLKKF